MDYDSKLVIYHAQVENVRSLRTAMRQVHRSINGSLRNNDKPVVEAFTKIYAILFCAWAEANFFKVLHTPHGFELGEIDQVKTAKLNGISEAWKKCVQLGLRHLDAKRGNFQPNARQKLNAAIDAHVFDPSLLRNKLAHGQWVTALNRDNDAVQQDITTEIKQLDVVVISTWIKKHELLTNLVENLIESPKRAFMRDWYQFVVDLEEEMKKSASRTLQDHVARLLNKDKVTGAKAKRR